MATSLGFKDIIDLPEWRPLSVAPSVSGAGTALACDLRNTEVRDPHIYQLAAATVMSKYSIKNDEWIQLPSPGLGGTFGAGAGAIFVPSGGPYGTLAAGCTTTSLVINTALPGTPGVNALANRGDGIGYKIRVVGSAAGSSGKIEEVLIAGNTESTTPTITLATPLTFTPAAGDTYEFLSGSVFLFSAGALAATIIRRYDIATQAFTSVTNTNFIATIATDMTIFAMDEQYVPASRAPGEGFFGNLVATNSALGTLTGQAAAGDAGVALNEFRNFQIRIVQDTAIPTAVGQRRKIASHTAGASPVYTLASNWSVTPSTTCTYVIEYNNDILAWNGVLQVTYSYLAGFNAVTSNWSTAAVLGGATQYANPPAAKAAGAFVFPTFGIDLDANKYARYSHFHYFQGGGLTTLYIFDIAAGANGVWSAAVNYGNSGLTYTTGACGIYDGATNGGQYGYLSQTGTQRFARYNVKNRCMEPWAYMRYPQSTVSAAQRMAVSVFIDGTTKLGFLFTQICASTPLLSVAIQR